MAGVGGIASNQTPAAATPPPPRDVNVGGQSFQVVSAGAPRFNEFQGKGGAYQAAWDNVAARLGTQDNGRVSDQLEWDYQMRQAPPADAAAWLMQRDTGVIATEVSAIEYPDTAKLANDLSALQSVDPARAQAIDGALSTKLSAADYGRMHQDMRTAQSWPAAADAKLSSTTDAPGQVDARSVDADAQRLLHQATSPSTIGAWLGGPKDHLSTTELAYGVQKLAETNPAQAQAVRGVLTGHLTAQDAGDFNRILAGDTHFGEGIGAAISHPGDGITGAAKSIAGFATNVGDLFVRGSMMQSAGEQREQAGIIGLTGNKAQADAMVRIADGIDQVAQQRQLPLIEPGNIAQQGGADIETTAEIGVGVAGAVRGGAGLATRAAVREMEGEALSGGSARAAAQVLKRSDPELIARNPLLTDHPNAHAVERHGGAVTDDQLITRARTGVAPDGSQAKMAPKFSSAFNSDALLVETDQALRAGPLQAAIHANPNATNITLKAADVGDLGKDLGRAYERIGNGKSADLQGPLREVTDLRSAQGTYELNQKTGQWETVTLFPVKVP